MKSLHRFLVETPNGEKFSLFAANEFDAGKQVIEKIRFRNSLVKSNTIVGYDKFTPPE